jgi:adenosylhomocysteinase
MKYDVKNLGLASQGKLKIEWAAKNMQVLEQLRDEFEKAQPLAGQRLAACLHVTSETANLMRALKAGGAEVALCASNPLSTQDDVAASLVADYGIPTFAIKGEDNATYYEHIHAALELKPTITMDDGADLVTMLHSERRELLPGVLGGTEETTTGVIRLRAMAAGNVLQYPIIAVNDAMTKHLFDNRYGTGQSTIDGLLRATNMLMAGKTFVVFGYGMCGRGVAMRASGMGANVIVCEVSPLMALEAAMDGFRVMPSEEAATLGEVFVTVTGDKHVLGGKHFDKMKDGAILGNSGHFNVEIDIPALEERARAKRNIRPFLDEFEMQDGRRLYLIAEGRLLNLAAAEGHPAAVMDMSFANQALSAAYMAASAGQLEPKVYPVPTELDERIASLKLETMGLHLDTLTPEQVSYLGEWQEGT